MPRDERPGKKPYGSRGRRPRGSLRRIPRVVETNGEPAMKKRAFLYLSSEAQKPTGLKTSLSMVPRAARKGKYPELRVFTDYDLRSSAREALGSGRARAARGLRRTEKKRTEKAHPGPLRIVQDRIRAPKILEKNAREPFGGFAGTTGQSFRFPHGTSVRGGQAGERNTRDVGRRFPMDAQ